MTPSDERVAARLPWVGSAVAPWRAHEPVVADAGVPASPVQWPDGGGEVAPRATTRIGIRANLNAGALVPYAPFDVTDPSGTANASTTMKVDDSEGAAHMLDVYFAKAADNTWDYHVLVPYPVPNSPCEATWSIEAGNGTLVFDATGALVAHAITMPLVVSFDGAAQNQRISLFLGNPTGEGGDGRDGITQIYRSFSVTEQWQDGVAAPPRPVEPPPPHPMATANVFIVANLDARAATPPTPFDASRPDQTSNVSTVPIVYDANGAPHALSVSFVKVGADAWEAHVLVAGEDVAGGTAGTNVEICSVAILFSSDGVLQRVSHEPCSFDFVGAAPGQVVAMNLGWSIADGCSGLSGLTQFASPFSVTEQLQDGHAPPAPAP